MSTEIPPVVPDDRQVERRAGWHTPDDCFKLLDVQKAMDSIFARLKEGNDRMDSIFGHLEASDIRMGCMEDNIAGNHRGVSQDIKCIETKLDANTEATDENKKDTARILEIVEMGEGLFKGVKFIGKWLRRSIMWVVPPALAVIGLWQSLRPPK
jgi:hypothetical protein